MYKTRGARARAFDSIASTAQDLLILLPNSCVENVLNKKANIFAVSSPISFLRELHRQRACVSHVERNPPVCDKPPDCVQRKSTRDCGERAQWSWYFGSSSLPGSHDRGRASAVAARAAHEAEAWRAMSQRQSPQVFTDGKQLLRDA